MKGFMGISGKKMASVGFLLAVLFITLILGSLTFLINDNAATLPNVGLVAGLEGNCNKEAMSKSVKDKKDSM
jgi:hypothetical protein